MDKTAAKRKAKRRAEKEQELREAKIIVYNGLKDYARDAGFKSKKGKKVGIEEVWAARVAVEKELFVRAAVISNLAIIHTLAFDFKYGRYERLPKAFKTAVQGLQTVSNGERSTKQFNEEMKYQFNFDFYESIKEQFDVFEEDLLLRMGLSHERTATIVGLAQRVPSILVVGLYSMYFWLGLKKPSMLKLCRQATMAAIDMVKNDKFSVYQAELLKKTDIHFGNTGMIIMHYSKSLKGGK